MKKILIIFIFLSIQSLIAQEVDKVDHQFYAAFRPLLFWDQLPGENDDGGIHPAVDFIYQLDINLGEKSSLYFGTGLTSSWSINLQAGYGLTFFKKPRIEQELIVLLEYLFQDPEAPFIKGHIRHGAGTSLFYKLILPIRNNALFFKLGVSYYIFPKSIIQGLRDPEYYYETFIGYEPKYNMYFTLPIAIGISIR